jgi:hypothetical protein
LPTPINVVPKRGKLRQRATPNAAVEENLQAAA